ncbi:MAG: hypothetical protein WCL44_00855 [bacterium]
MNRFLSGMCVAGLVAAAQLFNGQTAVAAEKAATIDIPPARQAKTPGGSTNTVNRTTNSVLSRVHTRIEKDSEQEFLNLVNGRRNAMEEVRVIKRLIREKQTAIDKTYAALAADYAISRDRNYRYDDKTRTITDITGEQQTTNGTAKARTRAESDDRKRVHMVLNSKEKAARFVNLSSSKQLDSIVLQALTVLDREKTGDMTRYNNELLDKFGMSRDRSYEYDSKTGTLYELIPVPVSGKSTSR